MRLLLQLKNIQLVEGLVSIVAEYNVKFTNSLPQLILGLPDKFGKTAEYRYLLDKYRLVGEKIAADIMEFVNDKNA